MRISLGIAALAFFPAAASCATPPAAQAPTMAEVIAQSAATDWRPLDLENTLYLELPAGRVTIELAPNFAPNHVANIKALVREGYFDGLFVIRAQDNYVAQWGDPEEEEARTRPVKTAKRTLPAEFTVAAPKDLPFTPLAETDVYAPQVGFSNGLPAARDSQTGRAWLCHCYAMVGVGRDEGADTGGGTSLYTVIGHAPRNLDRNVTLVGRVMQGIELLSALPRGTGNLGFYEKPEQRVPIASVRVAADVPAERRSKLEILRTDTPTFAKLVDSRRVRAEKWYKFSPGHVELCNVPIVVRPIK